MRTQQAIQISARDRLEVNPALAVPDVGPTQLLLKVEACGICFSDTKLMHSFDQHPRKTPIQSGITPQRLAGIPTYRPGAEPIVPGHEPVARIIEVGSDLAGFTIGQRVVVQTDYRHLPTAASTASLGYDFDGALEEYVLVDEAMVVDPATGQHYLIPVAEAPSAGSVALLEPWACVENAYACPERTGLAPAGSVLIVADPGTAATGLADLIAAAQPSRISLIGQVEGVGPAEPTTLDNLSGVFDDIVYLGAQAETIETLSRHLGKSGRLNIVLGGAKIDRVVEVDAGRLHYDLIRYVGTAGSDVADGYRWIPATDDLRPGERLAIVGAAGPMGLMHAVRAVTTGPAGLSLDAVDISPDRLSHLRAVLDDVAGAATARFFDSSVEPLPPDSYTYVCLLVPSAALLTQAVEVAAPGAIVQAFAGFAVGTMAAIDLNKVIRSEIFLVGTSGSRVVDMTTVLERLETGQVDTNISIDAICGIAGVPAAIASVDNRTSQGKIVVFPSLPNLGLIRLADLAAELPEVAAQLDHGRWCKAAESALFATTYPRRQPDAAPPEMAAAPTGDPASGPADASAPTDPMPTQPAGTSTVPETAPAPMTVGGISPRAWRAAQAGGVDLATVTGTGPDGRITEADVRLVISRRLPPPPPPPDLPDDAPGPVEPVESAEPGVPGDPAEPDQPAEPAEPVEPAGPAELVVPGVPAEPAEPGVPDEPAEPAEPVELVVPGVPDETAEPGVANEPAKPDEPAEPAEPTGSLLSSEAVESAEPADVAESGESAAAGEAAAPEQSVEAQSDGLTEVAESVESTVIGAPVDPAGSVKPIEAAESTGPDTLTVAPHRPDGFYDTELAGTPLLLAGQMIASAIGRVQASYDITVPAAGLIAAQARSGQSDAGQAVPVSLGQVVAFVAVAVAARHPDINAIRQDKLIRHFDDVHLGLVVDTARGSLLATVRQADRLDQAGLAEAMTEALRRVDSESVGVDDLSGATLALADLSGTAVEAFTPVLVGSPVVVLGLGAVHAGAVRLDDGSLGLADCVTVRLTVDQAVVDHRAASAFLAELAAGLTGLRA